MTFSHKCYLISQKEWEKFINCSFDSPKTTFLAIFANFCQLWMNVYTAILNFFYIFSIVLKGKGVGKAIHCSAQNALLFVYLL